jgi:hypothetical protein
MNKHRLQLTDDTKSPIAMAGRLIILAMGEICPDRYVNRDLPRLIARTHCALAGCTPGAASFKF